MGRLDGQVAIISGGARGQGRELARKFAREGADIAVFDLCGPIASLQYDHAVPNDLAETMAIVESAGRRCISQTVDVRDYTAVSEFAAMVLAEWGRVDIVCANAGIANWTPLADLTPAVWQEMLDINVTGVFNTVHPLVSHFMTSLTGCVILTSSVNGREPAFGMSHYTASKHAVLGLMRNLALELGPFGVRVNAVMPSAIATTMGMNPENMRWIFGRDDATEEQYYVATRNWHALRNRSAMQPSVVADAAIWLASDEGRYITGIELPIDAGHLILPGFNHSPIVELEVNANPADG